MGIDLVDPPLPAGGSVDIVDRTGRLLGHVTVDSLPAIAGTVAVSSLPAITGTVAVSSLPSIAGTVAVSSVAGTVAVSDTPSTDDTATLLRLILRELAVTNQLLQAGLNVRDELDALRADPLLLALVN